RHGLPASLLHRVAVLAALVLDVTFLFDAAGRVRLVAHVLLADRVAVLPRLAADVALLLDAAGRVRVVADLLLAPGAAARVALLLHHRVALGPAAGDLNRVRVRLAHGLAGLHRLVLFLRAPDLLAGPGAGALHLLGDRLALVVTGAAGARVELPAAGTLAE